MRQELIQLLRQSEINVSMNLLPDAVTVSTNAQGTPYPTHRTKGNSARSNKVKIAATPVPNECPVMINSNPGCFASVICRS